MEIVELHGVRLPITPNVVDPFIAEQFRSGRYEHFEIAGLNSQLRAGDRVLDLGACHGLTSTFAARTRGVRAVMAVEASPRILPHLRTTYALNEVTVDLRHGLVIGGEATGAAPFYVRPRNWNSSVFGKNDAAAEKVTVPTLGINALMAEFKPTVLSCDIEGGEYDVLPGAHLDTVRAIIIELHPKRFGAEKTAALLEGLAKQGFVRVPDIGTAVKHVYCRADPS
ncbi:FkbM family methyltransferase [Tropicimonas sp. S265A]|uniref:FkbM family methyltransferase n=1 Tax=Tropicimonas sp. S265A TaxID=3415134 RepID=UPI003C7ADD45